MSKTLTLRCSALPLATLCPASIGGDIRADSADESAALGSAVHEVLARAIKDEEHWREFVDLAAARWSVDPEGIAPLAGSAWKCWEQLRPHFPDPTVEMDLFADLGGVRLTGHADVLSIVGNEVRVLDWKTGRVEGEHAPQLRGYGLCAMHDPSLPNGLERAYVATVLVRQQEIDPHAYTREDLAAWWDGLSAQLLQGKFVPGIPQCVNCPRRHDCGARTALLQQTAEVIERGLKITAANAGAIYDRARLLEGACEDARAALKLVVADAGGKLPLGDGRQLVIEQQQRRELNTSLALPVLREFMAESEVAGCLQVSAKLAETAAKSNAPRGTKGMVVKEMWDRLTEEGAVTIKTQDRLEMRSHVKSGKDSAGSDNGRGEEILVLGDLPTDDPRLQPTIE